MKHDLAYYRSLPYRLDVTRFVEEEDDALYYCAAYVQLPEVKGVHEDRLLAITLAKELFDSYVDAQLEWGEPIPEPESRRYREPGGLFKFKAINSSTESVKRSRADFESSNFVSNGEPIVAETRSDNTELAMTV